jgi:hypothetical protein
MPILFIAAPPRSSSLGVADLFYQGADLDGKPALLTGHLHLAAELSGADMNRYHSPLHLYSAREALVRCLMALHQMPASIDNYGSILKYYFNSPENALDLDRFRSVLQACSPLLIDPSFSHAMDVDLLSKLPQLGVEFNLLVLWRNPIRFSLDLMQGVYGFDSCLQWILAGSSLSFPLDPLMLWLEYVKAFVELIRQPPASLRRIIHVPRETVSQETIPHLCSQLLIDYRPGIRLSSLGKTVSMFSECPYSGDPSYAIDPCTPQHLQISYEDLRRFSRQERVVRDVVDYAKTIGYEVIP